jgi:hypothetical protein
MHNGVGSTVRSVDNQRNALWKASEHGLGHLLDPTAPDVRRDREKKKKGDASECIRTIWHLLVAEGLGQVVDLPSWLDRPAVSRVATIDLLDRFGGMSRNRRYAERMKPFNFLLSAHVAKMGHASEQSRRSAICSLHSTMIRDSGCRWKGQTAPQEQRTPLPLPKVERTTSCA